MKMSLTDFSFTPTEFILLNGDKFAPESTGPGLLPLLCSDGSVDGQHLVTIICAAAILANEEVGALSLKLVHSRKLLGLKESDYLEIRPIGQTPNWNGFTLESAVLVAASQAYGKTGDHSVQNAVYSILAEDRKHPWEKIVELVEWGLASSNWLMPVEGFASGAFSTPFICPAKVRELAIAQPAAPVVNLLTTCRKTRPEVWKALTDEIKQAINDRKTLR